MPRTAIKTREPEPMSLNKILPLKKPGIRTCKICEVDYIYSVKKGGQRGVCKKCEKLSEARRMRERRKNK